MGTTKPPAAASGARTSEVLSPTPPVECLSIFGAGNSDRSSTWPECSMASVSAAVSARLSPRSTRSHQPRGNLVVGNLPGGVAGDEIVDFGARQFLPVAFLANHIDGADRLVAAGSGRSLTSGEIPPEEVR